MDCYNVASFGSDGSLFFQSKFGVSSPSIEVYIAGCCSGMPLILTKTIQISPGGSCLGIVCWTQFLRIRELGMSTNMSMDSFHNKNCRSQTQSWIVMSQKKKLYMAFTQICTIVKMVNSLGSTLE